MTNEPMALPRSIRLRVALGIALAFFCVNRELHAQMLQPRFPAAQEARLPSASPRPPIRAERLGTDRSPPPGQSASFGQRLALGAVGGLALGGAAHLLADDAAISGPAYMVGAAAGVILADAHYGRTHALATVAGVTVGAVPLFAAYALDSSNNGEDLLPGFLAFAAAFTIPLGGAIGSSLAE